MTWISSQSDKEALSEVDVFLPRPFTTKYVTAAFIESQNLIPEAFRDDYPDPNVDCSSIIFSGHRLKIPSEHFS